MTEPLLGKRYLLQQTLGAGGMGAVHLAHDRLTGETVALKQVLLRDKSLSVRGKPAESVLAAWYPKLEGR